MARLKFDALAHYPFCTELQIYTSHINHGNHLDNAQLLSLVSEARVRFFQSLGYPEADVGGLSIVVGDIVAQYKSEGFHGETMRVEMAPADFNRYGFDLVFRMTEKAQGREVACGKIGIVFIGKSDRKVAAIPESIRQLLVLRAVDGVI